MKAFLYGTLLQWKLDLRNKGVIVTYYIVPLIFFLFMGGIFTSILPEAYKTLIQSMTVFGVTMGAILGAPTPLTELYGSEIKKAYKAGNIPLWTATVSNFISSFIHLLIMSMVIFFAAPFLFGAIIPENFLTYFISLLLLIIASLCIGTVFGLFVKNTSKLSMLTQFAFLPSVMLSGIMFPADMLPITLQYIGKIFPATWSFQAMCKSQLNLEYIFPLIMIIAVLTALSFWKISKINVE